MKTAVLPSTIRKREINRTRLNLRSFTSLIVTWAFAIAIVTGTVLYIVPQGRIAYWMDWQLIGLGKTDWGNIHIIFGAIFVASGIFHLYYNWKPFKKFLTKHAAGHLHVSREAIYATTVSLLLVAAAIADVPPASWVFDLNETVKSSWVTEREYEPPYGHAEESSLRFLARRTNIDLEKALGALRDNGIKFDGEGDTLKKMALRNGATPLNLYMLIKDFEKHPALPKEDEYTAQAVEELFEGTGIGRKTLAEIITSTGIGKKVAFGRLAEAGVSSKDEETLRQIADRHDLTPIDILKTILVKEFKPTK